MMGLTLFETPDGLSAFAEKMADLFQIPMIGKYMSGLPLLAPEGSIALTANYLEASPFFVPRAITFDRIAVHVTVAATAGKVVRLGIYNDPNDGTFIPSSLVVDVGTALADTTGLKEITITGNKQLTKGWYWVVVHTDGAPSIAGNQAAWSPLGYSSALNVAINSRGYVADTYGVLPATFTAGIVYSTTTYGICLRVLSLD